MRKKLLHKTQQIYIIYSIITFLIISPIFYFTTEKLYLDDTDETLMLNKERFEKQILPGFKIKDISTWNTYNPENLILDKIPIKKDSIFSTIDFSELEQEDEPYRMLFSPIKIEGQPYLYTEKINLVEAEDLLFSIAILFITLIILLMIGVFIITNRISKKIWKPFYELIHQIEEFEIDKDPKPHFKTTTIEEFNRLNEAVEKLMRKNIKIYNNQREFIDNAAHELQTPLAIFRSKIDLLIQRDDLTHGQAAIVVTINENIDRLIKLNKNLLILSKIDRNIELEVEKFSLKLLLEKQIEFFSGQANTKQIQIKNRISDDVIVNANKNLTEILFSNLLLNAMKYNVKNGTVIIELDNGKVSVSNTSDQTKIPKDKLFNRFSKSNQNQQGNGLGLAIVKKIVDQNNWEITYNYSKNRHFFTVTF